MIFGVCLLIFTVTVIADYIWARWADAVACQQPFAAGVWGACTIITSGAMAIFVVESPWMMIPGALGAFVGTYISVHLKKKRA